MNCLSFAFSIAEFRITTDLEYSRKIYRRSGLIVEV